jgi:hypothetical protein
VVRIFRQGLALCALCLLVACGGGDSTTSTVSGNGLNSLGQSPAVATAFVQAANNLRVTVEDGPHGFQLSANANILYATVSVCSPVDTSQCVQIDHVQVDTGSVGLRVLASKVKSLNLPPLQIASGASVLNARECFPFVIGGLWGANVNAVVGLGQQQTSPLAIQLIEDDTNPNTAMQPTTDCNAAANGNLLASAESLGSNGILGIGSTNIDCGQICVDGDYTGTFVQYYGCPPGALSAAACFTNTKIPANFQVSNPVFHLPVDNNGVILVMPAVTNPGAASASGELIFGIGTQGAQGNNQLPAGIRKVFLGLDSVGAAYDSYLNISTQYSGSIYVSSYLDTGTNGLFFDSPNSPVKLCTGGSWYCPSSILATSAKLWDGGVPLPVPPLLPDPLFIPAVDVPFQIGNAEALFSTRNTAFSDAAGAAPSGSTSFAWGMPFFYGKKVYMSIWDISIPLSLPLANPQSNPAWYAWTATPL